MSLYLAKNNSFGVDMVVGDMAYSNALFGIVEVEVVGDLSAVSIFGFNIFERVGNISALFGVSWL